MLKFVVDIYRIYLLFNARAFSVFLAKKDFQHNIMLRYSGQKAVRHVTLSIVMLFDTVMKRQLGLANDFFRVWADYMLESIYLVFE